MRYFVKAIFLVMFVSSLAYGQSNERSIFAVVDTAYKADGILLLDDLPLRFTVGAKVYGKDGKPITTYALRTGQKVLYKIQLIRGAEYIKEVRVLPETADRKDYPTDADDD